MNTTTHGLFRMALAAALSITVSGADASGTSDGATSKPTSAPGAIPSAEVMNRQNAEFDRHYAALLEKMQSQGAMRFSNDDYLRQTLEGRRASNAADFARNRNGCAPSESGMYNADCGSEARQAVTKYGRKAAELIAWERRGGAQASRDLRAAELDTPTPNWIPGGWLIPSTRLLDVVGKGFRLPLIDVLGATATLPGAIVAPWASAAGTFDDATQARLAQLLSGVAHGDINAPIVFFSRGPDCWRSYNAASRAIALGYRNVLWYRGGIESWQRAGRETLLQNIPSRGRNTKAE